MRSLRDMTLVVATIFSVRRVDASSRVHVRVRKPRLHARTRRDAQTRRSDLASSISAYALNKSSAHTCTCSCAPLDTASVVTAAEEPVVPATPPPASPAPAAEAAASAAAVAGTAAATAAAEEASNASIER